MSTLEFKLPDIGEGLAEAEIVEWLVSVGDHVRENQTIAEVETDKAVVELPSPATGVVKSLPVGKGDRVKVGSVIIVLETSELLPARSSSPPASTPAPAPLIQQPQASPAVRKLAAELGVEISRVRGTAPGGRVSADDVRDYANSRAASSATAASEVERIPIHGIRRRIAENLTQTARTVPHVCGFHELDAYRLRRALTQMKPAAAEQGIHLTYLAFVVRAVAQTLAAHPYLNASYDEHGPAIVLHNHRNVGIAMATPEGLVVPVIRDADKIEVFGIAKELKRLSAVVRDRQLQPADLKSSTFTISNVGGAGGWFGTSILNGAEAAILGVGRIDDRVVFRNGKITVRPILPISLTFDHRVIDGEAALAFIAELRNQLDAFAATDVD